MAVPVLVAAGAIGAAALSGGAVGAAATKLADQKKSETVVAAQPHKNKSKFQAPTNQELNSRVGSEISPHMPNTNTVTPNTSTKTQVQQNPVLTINIGSGCGESGAAPTVHSASTFNAKASQEVDGHGAVPHITSINEGNSERTTDKKRFKRSSQVQQKPYHALSEQSASSSSVLPLPLMPIIAVTSIGAVTYSYWIIQQGKKIISSPTSWCAWPFAVDPLGITRSPAHKYDQLIAEIQKKYLDTCGAQDTTRPFELFLEDLEKEKTMLTKFITHATFLEKIYLGSLYGIKPLDIAQAKESLARLEEEKKIFNEWAAQTGFKLP